MSYRTHDFKCPKCNHIESDVLVEPDEIVPCPECQEKMEIHITSMNFSFKTGYFCGLGGPRNVEVEYHQHDGKIIRKKLHNMPTDC